MDAWTKKPLRHWVFLCLIAAAPCLLLSLIAAAPDLGRAETQPEAIPVSATPGGNATPIRFPGTEEGIRSALDTLRTTGGTVTLEAGEYSIIKTLTVWDNTELRGQGTQTRLVATGPLTSSIQLLRVGCGCHVTGLALIGTGYPKADFTPYGSHGIVGGTSGLGGMNHTVIEGCAFEGWNTIAINLAPNSRGNVIRNNSIRGSGWEGIYVAQYCDSNRIEGNQILSCRRNAIDVVGSYNTIVDNHIADVGLDSVSLSMDTDGILLYSKVATTGAVRGNRVEGNVIQNAYNGISILAGADSDNQNAVIIGNTVSDCRASGVRVGGGPGEPIQRIRNIKIEDNEIARCDSSGIYVEKIPQCVTIRGNHIYMNRGDGIRVESVGNQVRGITITKNALISNGRRGIYVGLPACARVKHDNILEGNAEGPNGGASVGAASTK